MRGNQPPHHASKKAARVKSARSANLSSSQLRRTTQGFYRRTKGIAEDDDDYTTTIETAARPGKSASYGIEGIRGVKFRNLNGNVQADDVQFYVEWTPGSEVGEDFPPTWHPIENVDSVASILQFQKNINAYLNAVIISMGGKPPRKPPRLMTVDKANKKTGRLSPKKRTTKAQTTSFKSTAANTSREQGRKHLCETCGKSYTRMDNLRCHVKVVHEKKPAAHACNHCSLSFHTKQGLRRHMLTTTDGPPAACTSCEKTFRNSEVLRKHFSRVHTSVLKTLKGSK